MVSLLHIEKKRVVSACNLIENKVLDTELEFRNYMIHQSQH